MSFSTCRFLSSTACPSGEDFSALKGDSSPSWSAAWRAHCPVQLWANAEPPAIVASIVANGMAHSSWRSGRSGFRRTKPVTSRVEVRKFARADMAYLYRAPRKIVYPSDPCESAADDIG